MKKGKNSGIKYKSISSFFKKAEDSSRDVVVSPNIEPSQEVRLDEPIGSPNVDPSLEVRGDETIVSPNVEPSAEARGVESEIDSIERDPALRVPIEELEANRKDEIRLAYIKLGTYQPILRDVKAHILVDCCGISANFSFVKGGDLPYFFDDTKSFMIASTSIHLDPNKAKVRKFTPKSLFETQDFAIRPCSGSINTSLTQNDGAPLWCYVTKLEKQGQVGGTWRFQCNICNEIRTGSYSRVRAHLLQLKNAGIAACKKVSMSDKLEIKRLEEEFEKKKSESGPKEVPLPSESQMDTDSSFKRRKSIMSSITRSFGIEARDQLDQEIARMFYTGGLPFNLARNPHYLS
ncbi:hypothetical protein OROMI_018600 [Orobanche minor]